MSLPKTSKHWPFVVGREEGHDRRRTPLQTQRCHALLLADAVPLHAVCATLAFCFASLVNFFLEGVVASHPFFFLSLKNFTSDM